MARRVVPLLCALGCLLLVRAGRLPGRDARAAAAPSRRARAVTCYSVHETFDVGEVFADDHCRRVKCINYKGEGFVIEVERCPLPDIPRGAKCRMTEQTDDKFPLCCPRAVCEGV